MKFTLYVCHVIPGRVQGQVQRWPSKSSPGPWQQESFRPHTTQPAALQGKPFSCRPCPIPCLPSMRDSHLLCPAHPFLQSDLTWGDDDAHAAIRETVGHFRCTLPLSLTRFPHSKRPHPTQNSRHPEGGWEAGRRCHPLQDRGRTGSLVGVGEHDTRGTTQMPAGKALGPVGILVRGRQSIGRTG